MNRGGGVADVRRDVLVVCGLAVEAKIVRGPGICTIAGGGRSASLADLVEREIATGVVAIASFGVAGALVSMLSPGSLIVADRIVFDETAWTCEPAWSESLAHRLPQALRATIAGSDTIVADRVAKARLAFHDAIAVDMESHVAARAAARHGLPFIALRAIADTLDRALPPAARVAMRDDGGIDYAAVIRSLVTSPSQCAALIGIAGDMRRATAALRRGRRDAGDRLGFDDWDRSAP